MRAARILVATLVALVAVLVPALAAPRPAAAATPEALVSITLDSFSPALPTRTGTITVTGTVKNTSKDRIYRPRAYFWRNQAPITDTEGFDAALASEANDPLGARVIGGSIADLFRPDDLYLEAGDEATFRITVKVADLALSPTPGIYLMGVHVLQNEAPVAIGRARVFVPVLSTPPRNVLQLTSVVALASRPALLREGVFADDHLAAEIAPGGRLDVLLKAADQPDVTFAVDPELVEEVQQMRNGYQVRDGGSTATTTRAGTGRADAARWLDAFGRLLRTRDGYRLLYGSVDVAALAHHDRTDLLQASEVAAKHVPLTSSLPLLVWPGAGRADAETLAAAEQLDPAAVLLSDSSTSASAPLLATAADVGSAPVVSYTSGSFAGGPGPEPSDTPVHLRQRLLAENWIQATTEPAGSTLGRVRVISTIAQSRSDTESVRSSWTRPTTLTRLLQSMPGKWSGDLHYPDSSRARELDADQLGALSRLSKSWATWQDVLVDRGTAQEVADAALARVASVRGRGDDETFRSYVETQQQDLDAKLDQIRISATPKVLIPKSRVSFPVTVRNLLPHAADPDDDTTNAVRVTLGFISANGQRLSIQPVDLYAVLQGPIVAGQNATANAHVEARTNGTVRVTAQLYTESGLPVGVPVTIDVTATQAGNVGWLIALAAGVVLVGTTALRIRQVTRDRARQAAAAEADDQQSDATRSAPAEDTGPHARASIDV